MKKPVWVGLVEVRPLPGNDQLADAAGAFVQAFAPARRPDEFVAAVIELMNSVGYEVVGVDDVEPFEDRRRRESLKPDFIAIADEVGVSQQPAYEEHWHTYRAEDEVAE